MSAFEQTCERTVARDFRFDFAAEDFDGFDPTSQRGLFGRLVAIQQPMCSGPPCFEPWPYLWAERLSNITRLLLTTSTIS